MTSFKSDKLLFDKDNLSFIVNRNESKNYRTLSVPTFPKKFNIDLLEITGIENPSDITIEVLVNSYKQRLLKLYEFRTSFIFQNGYFILDTIDKKQFQFEMPNPREPEFDFSIKVISNQDFKMTMYYSTDQEQSQYHYEAL